MSFVTPVGILIPVMLILAVAITVIVVVNKKKKAQLEAAHAQMSYESKTLYHGSEKKVGITGILVALLIVYIVITDFVVPAMNPPLLTQHALTFTNLLTEVCQSQHPTAAYRAKARRP